MVFFSQTLPPLAGRLAAFFVASILLHGFLFHNSISKYFRLPHSKIPPIPVVVLIESLCIDCKHFVEGQLSTVFKSLGPTVMDLKIVPFGNAHYAFDDNDKEYLECQHGPAECDANLYEQCVTLLLYPNSQRSLPFLRCTFNKLPMGKREKLYERKIFASCANRAALDWASIAACHDDEEQARSMQKMAAGLTPAYHRGVPWVEVQGQHVEVPDDDTTALLRAVCHAYKAAGGSHPACTSSL